MACARTTPQPAHGRWVGDSRQAGGLRRGLFVAGAGLELCAHLDVEAYTTWSHRRAIFVAASHALGPVEPRRVSPAPTASMGLICEETAAGASRDLASPV